MPEIYDIDPEHWALELHHMANAGFGDLLRAIEGLGAEGQPALDLAAQVTTAFELVTDGLELEPGALAENLAEFLGAVGHRDPVERAEAMRYALANLSERLGFAIGE